MNNQHIVLTIELFNEAFGIAGFVELETAADNRKMEIFIFSKTDFNANMIFQMLYLIDVS